MSKKVLCPQCQRYWNYGFDRKVDGKVVQPTKIGRLTCNPCHTGSKFQASGDALTNQRSLQKADRMDNDDVDVDNK